MIDTNVKKYLNDFEDVARLFFPDYRRDALEPEFRIEISEGDLLCVTVCGLGLTATGRYRLPLEDSDLVRGRKRKRYAKISFYRLLEKATGRRLPWGSLTGIRPTATARMLSAEGENDPIGGLVRDFNVDPEYARMVGAVLENQAGHFSTGARDAALYIHVPVCPSRCYYCSFVSEVASKCKNLDAYADALRRDIEITSETLRYCGCRVTSVYMGGGTPTVFSAGQLDRVLSAVPDYGVEFTVEAGRPDTLNGEKFDVMARRGVTRISINPQTFSDATLTAIGRKHSAAQIESAYLAARRYSFAVNMDLIMGLYGETPADTDASVRACAALNPENITLHTLCKKRGSDVHTKNVDFRKGEDSAIGMMTGAQRILEAAGYAPYYLYRQKNMLAGLHNVGYARPDCQCRNNIDTMEERVTVAGCGSGAISKRLGGTAGGSAAGDAGNRERSAEGEKIARFAMVKPVSMYLERFDEMMKKKRAFFSGRY